MGLSLRPLEPGILPGDAFRIPEGARSITVGRARANELRVQHASVSSFHATIEVRDAASIEVIDHGSSNGTFVNGIRVGRHRLVEGDLLRFATAEFRIQSGSPDPFDPKSSETDSSGPGPASEGGSGRGDGEAEAGSLILLPGTQSRTATEEASLQDLLERLETDLRERDERLRTRDEEIRRLQHDLDEAGRREQRLSAGQSEARREVIGREGVIAGLNYELQTRDGQLRQLDEQRARLRQVCDDHAAALAELEATHARTAADLVDAKAGRAAALGEAEALLARFSGFADRLLVDWRAWIPQDRFAAIGDGADQDSVFARVTAVAAAIRGELDRIEPIWHRHGEGVQGELQRRCDRLRADLGDLGDEIARRQGERSALEGDLARLRELIDLEVRRAQGLSRRGIEIEIPERFEAMTIPRDHEQELLRALVERLEGLDQLLGGYRRSRKLRDVHHDLADFRDRLAEILGAAGVRAFGIAIGTCLTLRHRREVQVLSRKGWGTRQYAEIPFQPGEVVKVIRPGYRLGDGEEAVILRKVEVLIQGVEE